MLSCIFLLGKKKTEMILISIITLCLYIVVSQLRKKISISYFLSLSWFVKSLLEYFRWEIWSCFFIYSIRNISLVQESGGEYIEWEVGLASQILVGLCQISWTVWQLCRKKEIHIWKSRLMEELKMWSILGNIQEFYYRRCSHLWLMK